MDPKGPSWQVSFENLRWKGICGMDKVRTSDTESQLLFLLIGGGRDQCVLFWRGACIPLRRLDKWSVMRGAEKGGMALYKGEKLLLRSWLKSMAFISKLLAFTPTHKSGRFLKDLHTHHQLLNSHSIKELHGNKCWSKTGVEVSIWAMINGASHSPPDLPWSVFFLNSNIIATCEELVMQ